MRDYLFSQDSILLPATISGVACALFFQYGWKHMRKPKRLLASLGITAALFIFEVLSIRNAFGLDNTPAAAYYLASTLTLAIVLTILFAVRSRRYWLTSMAAIFSLALTLMLSINSFYQYFPSVASLFGPPTTTRPITITRSTAYDQTTIPLENQLFSGGISHGTLSAVSIPGSTSGLHARSGYIYLPPVYGNITFSKIKFPVLILLNGTPGGPSSWVQGNTFLDTMDTFASHHNGITPIVAIVDHSGSFTNDTECLDSSHGNAETYITTDVTRYLTAKYRVLTNPNNWGIGGFSEGGMCAAMLTLTHQSLFRHFLDMSGYPAPFLDKTAQTLPVLFHGSRQIQRKHNVDWLLQHASLASGMTAQFAIGSGDHKSLIASMHATYHLALKRHMTTSLEITPDQGHNFGFWSRAYTEALPQLSYYLGATSGQPGH